MRHYNEHPKMRGWRFAMVASDLGTSIVEGVVQVLRIPAEWTAPMPRGITWWPGHFAQSLWSDPAEAEGEPIYRFHCESELVRGRGQTSLVGRLSHAMTRSTTSAVVYDETADLYKLHFAVCATDVSYEWLRRLVLAAIVIQAHDVIAGAPRLAEEFEVDIAKSGHPKNGERTDLDQVLRGLPEFIQPAGKKPSRWLEAESEWVEARNRMRHAGAHAVTDSQTYVRAEFEQEGSPLRIEIRADKPHATLGSGLSLHLVLPVLMSGRERSRLAVKFNRLERTEWTACHDFGSWCLEGPDLCFHAFIPNVAYAKGMLADLGRDLALRGAWATEHLRSLQ